MRRLLTDRQGAFRRLIVPVAAVALAAAIGNMLSVPMGGGLRLLLGCQSASNRDPLSARKRDPLAVMWIG